MRGQAVVGHGQPDGRGDPAEVNAGARERVAAEEHGQERPHDARDEERHPRARGQALVEVVEHGPGVHLHDEEEDGRDERAR